MAKKTTPTKLSTTVRYDVAWTLPFNEFTRQKYVEGPTWWVDSMHRDQTQANKRYNAIKDAIVAGNGSIVLFEVEADRGSDIFRQRALKREGVSLTPPPITEINLTAVDIDKSFQAFLARYHERVGKKSHTPVPRTTVKVRKKKSSAGMWLGMGALAASAFGVLAVMIAMQPTTTSGGLNGFNGRTGRAMAADAGGSVERPTVGILKMPNDKVKNGRRQCDVRKMNVDTLRQTYDHSEDC